MTLYKFQKPRYLPSTLAMVVLTAFLTGCVTFLHPLHTPDTLVWREELLGIWKDKPEADDAWIFEKREENQYNLIIQEKDGHQSAFIAHLIKLGDTYFLNLSPDDKAFDATKIGDTFKATLIPSHLVIKVKIGNSLELNLFNYDWVKKMAMESKALRYEDVENGHFIITSSTSDLQTFVRKYADTPEAWEESSTLVRSTIKGPELK